MARMPLPTCLTSALNGYKVTSCCRHALQLACFFQKCAIYKNVLDNSNGFQQCASGTTDVLATTKNCLKAVINQGNLDTLFLAMQRGSRSPVRGCKWTILMCTSAMTSSSGTWIRSGQLHAHSAMQKTKLTDGMIPATCKCNQCIINTPV